MTENFIKIKKKYLKIAIAASVVLGCCCSVALTCMLAVIFKAVGVDFFWAYYIPIAVVLAAASGGLLFLVLRPDDKKVAKKLDERFSLNQKAQTMVEFAHVNDAMNTLQREQADEAIAETVKKRVDLKWLLKFAFVPVLAAAMVLSVILVPAKKSAVVQPDPPPPYDITAAQETALKSLIADVNASSLKSTAKEPTAEVLNALLETLYEVDKQSDMRVAVISSVGLIDGIIATNNSFTKIYVALKADESLAALADAILKGATFYKSRGARIDSLENVNLLADEAGVEITEILQEWTEDFVKSIGDGTPDDNPLPARDARQKVLQFVNKLDSALGKSGYAPKEGEEVTDPLYTALSGLGVSLKGIDISGLQPESYRGRVRSCLNTFVSGATAELAVQAYGCMMDEFIRNSLSRIFNISLSEFGSNEIVVPSNPGSGNQDGDDDDGGYGQGNIILGSDDIVLDPNTGELVPYSKIINDFNSKIDSYIRSGACSEEVATYIRQYLSRLYGGIEDEEK